MTMQNHNDAPDQDEQIRGAVKTALNHNTGAPYSEAEALLIYEAGFTAGCEALDRDFNGDLRQRHNLAMRQNAALTEQLDYALSRNGYLERHNTDLQAAVDNLREQLATTALRHSRTDANELRPSLMLAATCIIAAAYIIGEYLSH